MVVQSSQMHHMDTVKHFVHNKHVWGWHGIGWVCHGIRLLGHWALVDSVRNQNETKGNEKENHAVKVGKGFQFDCSVPREMLFVYIHRSSHMPAHVPPKPERTPNNFRNDSEINQRSIKNVHGCGHGNPMQLWKQFTQKAIKWMRGPHIHSFGPVSKTTLGSKDFW